MTQHRATRRAVAVAAIVVAAVATPTSVAAPSDPEVGRVLAHGPWPPPWRPDPSNRVSGNPEAIALGAALFREPRLSRTGTIACSSCHQPARAFADGLAHAKGMAEVPRNTISVANARLQRWFGWDGAGDSLGRRGGRSSPRPRWAAICTVRRCCVRTTCVAATVTFRHRALRSRRDRRRRRGQGAGGVPGNHWNGAHAVRRLSRCTRARRSRCGGAVSGTSPARPRNLRWQRTLQHLPHRAQLHQRRVP